MAGLCMVIGLVLAFFGLIQFLAAAFDQHILWGLGCLFLPIVQIAFLVLFWDRAKKGFFTYLWAFPFLVVAGVLHHR